MVPLVALIAHHRDITVDGAMKEGTRVLAAFDVPGPYALVYPLSDEVLANLDGFSVKAGNGARYTFWVLRAKGRRLEVSLDSDWHGGTLPPRPRVVLSAAEQRAKAERALARLNVPYDVLSGRYQPWGPRDFVRIPIAFHARPFANTTTYDYTIQLDAVTGEFYSFRQPAPPPEIDPAPVRIDEATAIDVAERLLVSPQPEGRRSWTYVDVRLTSGLGGRFEKPTRTLGWYLPHGEARARLVWDVPYFWQDRTPVSGSHPGGTGHLMIDAATGRALDFRPAPKMPEPGTL